MHARWQHQIPSIPMLKVGGWGGVAEFDAEFKFAKIQNSNVEGGWGGSWNVMLSSNLLKSKIPMLRVGGRVGEGLTEFDAEFKFAKIPNSYVDGGWGGSRNLMLSSNLLKSKIPPTPENGNFSSGLDLKNLKLTFRNCLQVTE